MRTQPDIRELDWPNCLNVRDLGGLDLPGGKRTRWHAVVRGDLPARLSNEGRQALIDYNIRTVIDLRKPQEVAQEPTIFGRNAPSADLTILNLPAETADPAFRTKMKSVSSRAAVYCAALDWAQAEHVAIMQAIVHARPGGVYVHCHSGKDRTGIVVALLLGVAGVSAENIAADYALTQKNLWPSYEQIVAEAGGEEYVGKWLKPITTPETMLTMLDYLDMQYGGAGDYLVQAGLTVHELELLRARLMT